MTAFHPPQGVLIRAVEPRDRVEIERELISHWGATEIWSIGRMHHAAELPGFVAERDGQFVGLVTYHLDSGRWQGEIITLSSRRATPPRRVATDGTETDIRDQRDSIPQGVGSALLEAATKAIYAAGCVRAFLTTTNDNIRAFGFYQRRGWRLAAIHVGIVDRVRTLKPDYPLIGLNEIEIHDELELERWR